MINVKQSKTGEFGNDLETFVEETTQLFVTCYLGWTPKDILCSAVSSWYQVLSVQLLCFNLIKYNCQNISGICFSISGGSCQGPCHLWCVRPSYRVNITCVLRVPRHKRNHEAVHQPIALNIFFFILKKSFPFWIFKKSLQILVSSLFLWVYWAFLKSITRWLTVGTLQPFFYPI